MASFKCKMCGGALDIQESLKVIECEYCGTKQTLPKLNDDRRANMFDRANHLRRNNEFDKASKIYDEILNEDSTDAETYWSLVLCRYGIEYVEDPITKKRVPTINRAQYTSIYDDDNYRSAIQYADISQRIIYEEEAKAINEIQKGILTISQKEEPFDVFICYKETDNNGRRTPDSVLAQELYYQLTNEGFKVFFARITLEDKLGSAYEPYIFAALNSAKVMVALGTRPEHFNAVWVKNEWSRYLSLIKQGKNKILIPAYRDMDPYDLPDEFSHLQAQDMSKLGFMQDLIRGIKKILGSGESKNTVVKETVVTNNAPSNNVAPLLKRVEIFLEDEGFSEADEYCERVLDIDPENGQAYVYKLLIKMRVKTIEDLKHCNVRFCDTIPYKKALRYADEKTANQLREYNKIVSKTVDSQEKNTQSVNNLQAQKREIEDLILKKGREKQNLETAVKKREEQIARLSSPKAKILAFINIFGLIATIIFLVGGLLLSDYLLLNSDEYILYDLTNVSVGAVFLLSWGMSFYLFSRILKILGWNKKIIFANFYIGLPSVVFAVILLVKSSQNSIDQKEATLQKEKEKIKAIALEIESALKQRKDIDNALESVTSK